MFPLVEALAGKSDQRAGVRLETTIDALLGEHQHIRNLLRKLESHRATFLCERHEGCRALVEKLGHVDRHLRECMALEDNVLFPRAIGARENSYAGTLAGTGA